jgi:UrcA family protein
MARHVLSLIAVCALAVPGLSAASSPNDDVIRIVVPTRDLNLQNEQGMHRLLMRIDRAAHEICGHVDPREVLRAAAERRCVRQVVERTVVNARSEQLSQAYYKQVVRTAG